MSNLTIDNKDWLRTTAVRLYLSGLSQEEISNETGVSEGTVNAILQYAVISDDTLKLQREIAITCKKGGISVKQLASNMVFENSIKRGTFEEGKIHSFLKAIESKFTKDGIFEPDFVAKIIFEITMLVMKNGLSLQEVCDEIQNKYHELNGLNQEIKNTKTFLKEMQSRKINALSEHRLTRMELNKFRKVRKCFEAVGLDFNEIDEIKNVLRNIKEKKHDIPDIINELKKIRSLQNTKQQLQNNCDDLQNILTIFKNKQEAQKRSWGFLYPAIETLNGLLRRGIDQNIIHDLFAMLQNHPYLSINNLSEDIDTYGRIEGAIYKMRREHNDLIDRLYSLKAQSSIQIDTNIENTF
jgi:hypothetical protein